MARRRWTFALIIICLPILATVITAFRVRDLPRSHDRSEKCDDCELKVRHKVQSVKIESDKPKLEDLKKAVKEKQEIRRNVPEQVEKPTHLFEVRSDEDDDDDSDEHLLNVKIGFTQEHSKVSKVKADTKPAQKQSFLGFFGIGDDEEEDEDDDDEEDDIEDDDGDDEKVIMRKMNTIISKKIKDSKSSESSSSNEDLLNSDNDDRTEKIVHKKVETKHKDSTKEIKGKEMNVVKDTQKVNKEDVVVKNIVKKTKDDKNDDSKVFVKKLAPQVLVSPQIVDKNKPQTSKFDAKKPEIRVEIKHNDDDEDDDEDDDDDDDIVETKAPVKKAPTPVSAAPLQQVDKIKLTPKEKSKEELPKKNVMKESVGNTRESNKIAEPKPKPAVEVKKVEIPKKQEPLEKDANFEVKSKSADNEGAKSNVKDTVKSNTQPKEDDKKGAKIAFSDVKKEKDQKPIKSSEESSEQKFQKGEPKVIEKNTAPETIKHDEKHFDFKKDVKIKTDTKNNDKYFTNKDESKEYLIDSEEIASKSNLKHVSDALHRRNLLKSEFEDFYAFFPTFAPNFSHIHNSECRRHGQILLRQLRGMKLWALNMLDATAKIPSGILQGNGIQLGDFDQCLGSRARVQLESGSVVKVQGKYCLARVDVKAEHPELELPVHLAQAKNLIRSRLDDPGHFVPRFSTLSWGVCVPSPCGPEDVEVVIKDAIKHYQRTSGVVVRVKVDPDDCHVEEMDAWWEPWLELPTLLTLSFYGIVVLLVLVATTQDFLARRPTEEETEAECNHKNSNNGEEKESQGSENVIGAFSLYHTIKKLLAPGSTDEISCIHGVRAIATLALLVAHKFLPVAVTPYTNRLQVTETVSSPIWSWCRAGWVYTDCFLLLSGALTAHRITADTNSAAPWRLFLRYIRLTPALLGVVLFYAYIWDHLSYGPMWGTFVTKNAQVCQEGWWWNLLYIQNYFGFDEMCAPQTHQLALDMQLTILGGLIVWATQIKDNMPMALFPALHLVAAYSRFTTVRDHRLTLLAYHGVSVSQLYRTARLSYMSVLHRSTPYLVGISLGLALRTPRKHGMFLTTLGWVVSSVLWGLVWWAGFDSGSTQYRYNVTFAAKYAALAPLASSLAIAWVIYAVHNGSIGFLANFLCCRPLVFISRLSYALFLCQFIIFITDVATVRTSSEFTVMSLVDVKEICLILLSSIILTLTLVIPLQSMHKAFTSTSKVEINVSRKSSTTLEPIIEEPHEEVEENNKVEPPRRQYLVAHREVLEEIPETEIEYEMQREKTDGLEEILEEEEDDDDQNTIDDDLEIIEEEEEGEGGEEYWPEREERTRRRVTNENDQDLEEWEWTANGRSGAQRYHYNR